MDDPKGTKDDGNKDGDEGGDGLDLEALRVKGLNAGEALRLKRQRDFDVENARAEWRIGERRLFVYV